MQLRQEKQDDLVQKLRDALVNRDDEIRALRVDLDTSEKALASAESERDDLARDLRMAEDANNVVEQLEDLVGAFADALGLGEVDMNLISGSVDKKHEILRYMTREGWRK